MTRIQAIEEEIKKLTPEEMSQLRDWLLVQDAEAWDRQIEEDARSGKLERLFEKAVEDHQDGRSSEL